MMTANAPIDADLHKIVIYKTTKGYIVRVFGDSNKLRYFTNIFHVWWNYNSTVKQWKTHIERILDAFCEGWGGCQWQAKSRYSSRLDTVCKRLVSTDHFDQNFEGPALFVCTVIITMLMNGDRVSSNSRPLFWQPPTANRRARSRDLH